MKPAKKKPVKDKTKPKVKYVLRVMPVSKTYKPDYPYIWAYEDGIQVCKFECEHQKAFDAAIFHLQALAYKDIKK